MDNAEAPLQTYRDQIDMLDDQIIQLLKERIDIVSKVGALKKENGEAGVFIRSGREGRMHRRIFEAFQGSGLDPQAALQIWRILISASTHHESPMRIVATHTREASDLLYLTKEYFGSFLKVETNSNPVHIISDIYERKASIGVLPYPDDETNWWHALAQYQEPRVYIFAKLPLCESSPHAPSALAVAEVTPESSAIGDEVADESYFVLTLEDTLSTSRLHTVFQEAGLNPTFLNTSIQPPMKSMLVKLDGFLTDQDAIIIELCNRLEGSQLRWLGAHPKPIAI